MHTRYIPTFCFALTTTLFCQYIGDDSLLAASLISFVLGTLTFIVVNVEESKKSIIPTYLMEFMCIPILADIFQLWLTITVLGVENSSCIAYVFISAISFLSGYESANQSKLKND